MEDIALPDQFLAVPLGLGSLPPQPLQIVTPASRCSPGLPSPGHPGGQRALVDPEILRDLGDRLPGLRHDP